MTQTVTYLRDYSAPAHLVPRVELDFDIFAEHTLLTARLHIVPQHGSETLRLAGSAELVSLALDGRKLPENAYTLQTDEETLLLHDAPAVPFILEVVTRLYPSANKSLMGLYESGGNLYTQCEPEGFRKMTFHPDRPDVMGIYAVEIRADAARYPVLLSNGNRTGAGRLPENRHWARWEDPFAKPSYLFALVAGDLALNADTFATRSGREVTLEFYTRATDADKVGFALESLKQAMKWDEERFGLEYDLDTYMVVAVGDFNMGAMENKGLNIFNTKFVLADARSATDADFEGVEGVIAHEYFHNWTGNRVTCRDWFQLSLKEGLTVFRDQEFSADRIGRGLKRIEDVALLRQHQFPEDAGPTAHPVRPASYVEMNNFYTMTVYEKGAEVVRMYHTLLGEAGFQRGMQRYFARHDGQAVTCDDFLAAMADANNVDLSDFSRWYAQSGTPVLDVSGSLKNEGGETVFVLDIKQHTPPTPDQADKQPLMMPFKVALFSAEAATFGEKIPFRLPKNDAPQYEAVLVLRGAHERFSLYIPEGYQHVVPSLLRGFSAPVHLNYAYTDADLSTLLSADDDPFARWEAAQTLYRRAVAANEAALRAGSPLPAHDALMQAVDYVLRADLDPAFQAALLHIPPEAELWAGRDHIDPLTVHRAREALLDQISVKFHNQFKILNQEAAERESQSARTAPLYQYEPAQAGWRRLRNACRASILRADPQHIETVAEQYDGMAQNMTHEWGILSAVNHNPSPARNRLLERFAEKFADNALVMDKYFSLTAASHRADTPVQVQAALSHPAFSLENPNKARALLGSFARNVPHFHAENGSGYVFLAEKVRQIDAFNPQTAARLVQAFNLCRKLEPRRQALVEQQLRRLAESDALSKDVREIVEKILG